MASLTAVLRCTWPSGDIGLDFEDLQEVRLRPVVVFSWQHPGNGESTVRIASLECPGDLVLEGFWPARAAPREGPSRDGRVGHPWVDSRVMSWRLKAALERVVSQAGHTLGS